ncbi:hypothetical protein E4U47_001390 [Claviceps purpurea]|nr:hypothetical protein E4U11_005233 [Claviceps purpurea]KAG6274737.1 hypothetical protein E4U47_001390 [Claviceps purpurea]
MLSLSSTTTAFSGPWDHRPSVPSPLSSSPIRATSPLSPVDRNTLPKRLREVQSSPIQQSKFRYASRPARQNPLLRSREALQESRRRNFFQNVRQRAEDKAWQRRDIEGQFLKNSLLADMGRLSHDAPVLSERDLEDAMTVHEERYMEDDEDMLGDCPQEDDDIEAMVASFEQDQRRSRGGGGGGGGGGGRERASSPGLSDEEYDDIFAELISREGEEDGESIQPPADHMDTS